MPWKFTGFVLDERLGLSESLVVRVVLASIGDLDMKLGSIGALDRLIKWTESGLQMYWEGTGDDGSSFLYLQL